jgi:hypothetical protein
MEHFRKIKTLNDKEKEKQLARSEMVKLKNSKIDHSSNISFLGKKQSEDL